jgi:two-component system chemotaxis response regulator CheY
MSDNHSFNRPGNGTMSKTILICDDDAGLRRFLARLLSPRYGIVEARDGRKALRSIAERCPDPVLLDMTMPELSGLQALGAYRGSHPFLPTVVLTGEHELDLARRALSLGARAYITKPFDAGALLEEVRFIFDSGSREAASPDLRPPWRLII